MLAKQIIDIVMGFSSVSHSAPSDPILRAKAYQFLNLYNLELFSETAFLNTDLHHTIHYRDAYDQKWGKGVRIYEDHGIFGVVDVTMVSRDSYKNRKLSKTTYEAALRKYSDNDWIAGPREYSFSAMPKRDSAGRYYTIFLFPEPTLVEANVTYIKNPMLLSDDSREEDIPVHPVYHQLLVDGTLWYIFQDDDGYRDTMKAAEAKGREQRRRDIYKNFLFNNISATDVKIS